MTDIIKRPPHYTYSAVEPINVIEAWQLGFHLGNVIKYISRAGRKQNAHELDDMRKARWYLDRYIEHLESLHDVEAVTDSRNARHGAQRDAVTGTVTPHETPSGAGLSGVVQFDLSNTEDV